MKIKPLWIKILICLLPFIVLIIVYLSRNALIYLGTLFPACPSYTYLDVYCPGCGNTRSVQHLLKGDITGSFRYNPFPVFGIIAAVLGYVEFLSYTFGKHIKLLPRSQKFWRMVILIFCVYYLVRNFIRPF